MNPMTNIKNVTKLSEQELKRESKTSWHDMYKGSAWIFVGGLPYDLTEGDIVCVFSQYGEIVNINLIRDKGTGKSKGFCFICFEDQRSTVLTVDNLNGIKILNRTIRVDHVADYKPPKDNEKADDITRRLQIEGCAPKVQIPVENIKKERRDEPAASSSARDDYGLPKRLPIEHSATIKTEPGLKRVKVKKEKKKKSKKEKKSKKSKKEKREKKSKKRRKSSSCSDDDSSSSENESSAASDGDDDDRRRRRK